MDHNFTFIIYVYVGNRLVPVHVSHEDFSNVIDEFKSKYGINRIPFEHDYEDCKHCGYLIESNDKTIGFLYECFSK